MKLIKHHLYLLSIVLLSVVYHPVFAQLPTTISYQGSVSGSGIPLDGNYAITFSLYDVVSGGTALWTDVYAVDVDNGLFQVELGSSIPALPDDIFDQELWLGINVAGDGEMSPRNYLTSVPYAFMSKTVEDGGISQSKLDTDLDLRINPFVVDGNSDVIGSLLNYGTLLDIISDKGYFFSVANLDSQFLSISAGEIGSANWFYESSDCTGQKFSRDGYLVGKIYSSTREGGSPLNYLPWTATTVTKTIESSGFPGANCYTDYYDAAAQANLPLPASLDVYMMLPNDPAVTGVSNTYPVPLPITIQR